MHCAAGWAILIFSHPLPRKQDEPSGLASPAVAAVDRSYLRGCGQPLRAADRRTANPEQGAVIEGAYVNAYFGLRYPLPSGWKAGSQPPRPSAGGYYVLSTPRPPAGAEATILIAAQDTFFAMPPVADAGEMTRSLVRSVSASGENPAAIARELR